MSDQADKAAEKIVPIEMSNQKRLEMIVSCAESATRYLEAAASGNVVHTVGNTLLNIHIIRGHAQELLKKPNIVRSHSDLSGLVDKAEATARALAQLMLAVVTLGLDETEPSISEVLERHKGVGAEMVKEIAAYRSALSSHEPKVCDKCDGTGRTVDQNWSKLDGNGRPEVSPTNCPTCHGTGVIKVKEL